ncbi:hypothetical protein TDB9533_03685 [Thalassocella blandensis]|nr:hypothetical protein TDB9533_03685 [Thalassocella blandensis]
MSTITLVQAAESKADHIHLMTAQPMNVNLSGLTGGAIQFDCNNPFASIQGATSVLITYDATRGGRHETLSVSSVLP